MAADEAVTELAAQLSVEETPVKLRCATCSQIAYNALRLPCCEQNICETCYNELEDMCQVCHHEPLDKSLCTPNKALRTTTKVFLKKKLLEKSKEQKKKDVDIPKASGTKASEEPTKLPQEQATELTKSPDQGTKRDGEPGTDPKDAKAATESVSLISSAGSTGDQASTRPISHESQMDVPQQSIEPGNENQVTAIQAQDLAAQSEALGERPSTRDSNQIGRQGDSLQNGQWPGPGMHDMMNGPAAFSGMSGMGGMNVVPGAFPMDFSAMMPMGGLPNMMGMGMDPMMNQMSQSMFGGFGGPNMGMGGMNGMNMGMGLGEQGQFGGPWMTGLDTFNGNSHGNGNFGGQGGYNMPSHQGNFNQMNHQQYAHNDFQNGYGRQGFQSRAGRGRRGGFQSGGFGRHFHSQPYQGNHNGFANHEVSNHAPYNHNQHMSARAGSGNIIQSPDSQRANFASETNIQELGDLVPQPENGTEATEKPDRPLPEGYGSERPERQGSDAVGSTDIAPPLDEKVEDRVSQEESKPLPIQTFISDEPRPGRSMPPHGANVPSALSTQYPGTRGVNRGPGFTNTVTVPPSAAPVSFPVVSPTEPKGVGVVGAPTGPKALRVGLPNTGRSGILLTSRTVEIAPVAVQVPKSRKSESPTGDHKKAPSRSRSRSPLHSDLERHHRTRSEHSRSPARDLPIKPQEDGTEQSERRHSRRHDDDIEQDKKEITSKALSHKSNRRHSTERDLTSRRRHRDRSHERDYDRGKSRDHNRENDRERDRSREKGRERDKDRSKEKERDRDRGSRRRRHRRSLSRASDSAGPTPTSARAPELHTSDEGSRKRRHRDHEEPDDRVHNHEQDHHDRKRSRRDHHSHSKHHASSRETSKPSTPLTPSFPSSRRESIVAAANNSFQPPTGPSSKNIPTGPRADTIKHHQHKDRDNGFQIQGRSRASERERSSKNNNNGTESSTARPTSSGKRSSEKDAHTLEREARDRERLLKEMQRRATMEGGAGGGAGAAAGGGGGGVAGGSSRRKGSGNAALGPRRSSVKYEDEDGHEALASRVERERESQRWR